MRPAIVGSAIVFAATTLACKDQGKISAQKASENVTYCAKLAEADVGEVERGMPEGAKKLAARLYAKGNDPKNDPQATHDALIRARREVPDLNLAKSTFFALADTAGLAIRNNLEQDTMAGQNLFQIFPALAKSTQGEAWVATTGAFPNTAAPGQPADKDWIAAVPVKTDDGKVVGSFVTGWTFRRFAYHLQESLRHELGEEVRKSGDTGKLPVFYVAVFDKSGAYGAPHTPDVNEKALVDLDLVGKTASGPAQGKLDITERVFGWGAARIPKLGPDIGVVVLRSEL